MNASLRPSTKPAPRWLSITGIAISRNTHYQLANRIAFAWKLATLGVPTVLVYLGFTGDDGIADAGEPFRDHAHWVVEFDRYAHGGVPSSLREVKVPCGASYFWLLVRDRPVVSISAPPVSRRSKAVG